MTKKKTAVIAACIIIIMAVCGVLVLVFIRQNGAQESLKENQRYVYAYVSSIQGNEITYTELEESVISAYLEEQESEESADDTADSAIPMNGTGEDMPTDGAGEMPTDGTGEMPANGTVDMPTDGADEMPANGTVDMPTDGADEMPTGGAGEMPTDGTGEMPIDGAGEMPTDGADYSSRNMGSGNEGIADVEENESNTGDSSDAGTGEEEKTAKEEDSITDDSTDTDTKGNHYGKREGTMNDGERNFGSMSTNTITALIPVTATVHTNSDKETTFQRLGSGDILKILIETDEEGKEVITEIWML